MPIIATSRFRKINTGILLLPVLLGGCGLFSSEQPIHTRKIAHHTSKMEETRKMESYLVHLSLAELALENGAPGLLTSQVDYTDARNFSLKKQDGTITQPVIVIEYGIKRKSDHRMVIVPFEMPHESSQFSDLADIMTKLETLPYTLYDLRMVKIQIPPQTPLGIQGNDPIASQAVIEDRFRTLLKNSSTIAPLVQTKIDLQETQFFMEHSYKDAAYIALENAKLSIAKAAAVGRDEDSATIKILSDAIEEEENHLRQSMPFTFPF